MGQGIDLHIHSNKSDSSLSFSEICNKAIENQVEIISITDHNSVDVYEENYDTTKLKIIPGIEISSEFRDFIPIHILGYGINPKDESLKKRLQIQSYNYLRSLNRMINSIQNDFDIDIKKSLSENNLSFKRVNIFKVLNEKFGSVNKKYIYKKYLNYDKFHFKVFSTQEAINLIHNTGGIAILAHPQRVYEKYSKDFEILISSLKSEGLDGIEVYHPSQIHKEEFYQEIAFKYALCTSGGSDNHGRFSCDAQIGYVENKKILKENISILERLYG